MATDPAQDLIEQIAKAHADGLGDLVPVLTDPGVTKFSRAEWAGIEAQSKRTKAAVEALAFELAKPAIDVVARIPDSECERRFATATAGVAQHQRLVTDNVARRTNGLRVMLDRGVKEKHLAGLACIQRTYVARDSSGQAPSAVRDDPNVDYVLEILLGHAGVLYHKAVAGTHWKDYSLLNVRNVTARGMSGGLYGAGHRYSKDELREIGGDAELGGEGRPLEVAPVDSMLKDWKEREKERAQRKKQKARARAAAEAAAAEVEGRHGAAVAS